MPKPTDCTIPPNDPVFQHYHDHEWGVPTNSDQVFFEKVCLEGFQSGLSWQIILHRREAFRQAFQGFDPMKVSKYTNADVERLMANPGIIRNRRKILSAVNNAQRALEFQQEGESLAAFFWQFEPKPRTRPARITHDWIAQNGQTAESVALAKALKKRGWSFVGPVNMYALMQALGIVNDHVHGCSRRQAIDTLRNEFR